MNNFRFYNPCEIYFGKEQEKNAGKLCAKYGHKVLMVYGKNSIKKNGVYDTVISSFKEENIEFIELNGVKPNPEMDLVYKGIEHGAERVSLRQGGREELGGIEDNPNAE